MTEHELKLAKQGARRLISKQTNDWKQKNRDRAKRVQRLMNKTRVKKNISRYTRDVLHPDKARVVYRVEIRRVYGNYFSEEFDTLEEAIEHRDMALELYPSARVCPKD